MGDSAVTLVNTTLGEIDESLLEKRTGSMENDNEIASWIEYWKDGSIVHRSAHVHLKLGIFGQGETSSS